MMRPDSARGWQVPATLAAFSGPLLLCAIALLQLYLRHTHEMFPWRGGGFAMFSTMERRVAIPHLFAHDAKNCALQGSGVALSDDVREKLAQAANLPSPDNLSDVLHALLDSDVVYRWGAGANGRRSLIARESPARDFGWETNANIVGGRVDVWRGTLGPVDCEAHGLPGRSCIIYERIRSSTANR